MAAAYDWQQQLQQQLQVPQQQQKQNARYHNRRVINDTTTTDDMDSNCGTPGCSQSQPQRLHQLHQSSDRVSHSFSTNGTRTPVGRDCQSSCTRTRGDEAQVPIKTIQGDGVRLTIVKCPTERPRRQPVCLKIRTTKKYKQLAAERDTETKDTGFSTQSGLTSKLERIMENQLVKFPYPLASKCLEFLEKYPTFTGTYSLESSLGADLVEELMAQMHWQDKTKLSEIAIAKRSNNLVWRYGCCVNNAHSAAASYPEESILSRINSRIRMSSKCGLYKLLWMNHSPHSPDDLQMNALLPKSYLLHPMTDEFRREIQRPGTTWILKPSNYSQGTALKLYRSSGDMKEFATLVQEHFKNFNAGDILVQKYIDDPLLVDKRKFDLRVFLLIVPHQEKNTLFAFYHPGYVRLTCRRYEKDSETLTVHLTNQTLQKRDSRYDRVKEATTWTPGELNCYLNKRHKELGICLDWVHTRLHPRIKSILGYIVSLMNNMEIKGRRCFELFGCDFLVDSQMRVWLIDVNSGPSLATHTEVLQRLIPGVIQEAIGLALEVVYKSQKFKFIYPLVYQNNYSLIFDGQTSTSLY